ncbi:MAG TPA: hypothetical protein VGE93_23355 [Bryobacteraceae bacterium]
MREVSHASERLHGERDLIEKRTLYGPRAFQALNAADLGAVDYGASAGSMRFALFPVEH